MGGGWRDLSSHMGEDDVGVLANDSRTADVEELAGDHDLIAARPGLHLNVDLKWVRSIEHLPCASTCRSSSFENRLQKTVEENFDTAARSLSLTRQPGPCKCCLGDSDGALRRLVIRFRSRRLPNSLPQRNRFGKEFGNRRLRKRITSLLRAPSESPRQHLQGPGWRVKERERAAVSKFSSTVFCSRFSKELDRQVLAQGRCSIERTHFRSTFRWRPGLAAIRSWSPASSSTSAVLESLARTPTSSSPICEDKSRHPPPIRLTRSIHSFTTAEICR